MEIDGEKVRRLRLARVLTLRQLACKSQMSYTNLSRLERGLQRAQQTTIQRLAETLGVAPVDLLKPESCPDEKD